MSVVRVNLIVDEYDGEILNKSESKEHVLNVTRRNSNSQRGNQNKPIT